MSVRLDLEAFGSLRRLEATGLRRSEAIRQALVAAADRLWEPEALAAEASMLMNDSADQAELRRLNIELEGLDEPFEATSDAPGDIVSLRLGHNADHEQAGTVPGVILQSNALLPWSTVLVAPLSTGAQPSSFRPEIEVGGVMTRVVTDQLRAADISRIGEVVGRLSVSDVWSVERALQRVLDL